MLGGAHEGQAGAVLDRVQVHGAVHDHAIARSLSVIHGQGTAHGHRGYHGHLLQERVQHIMVRADRVIRSVNQGLPAAGIDEGDIRVAGLVAHRHEGDVVGAGRHLSTGIVDHFDVVHLRTRVGCREGGLGAERHRGEQSHGKEQDLLHAEKGICLGRDC